MEAMIKMCMLSIFSVEEFKLLQNFLWCSAFFFFFWSGGKRRVSYILSHILKDLEICIMDMEMGTTS